MRGYDANFNLLPDCIECKEHSLIIHPEDFEIDEVYRFEGMNDPGDNEVLYAISSSDHKVKGVLLDAYGTYADAISEVMLDKLKFAK